MEYCAKVNIGVPGYGRLTPGEYLDEKCKEVLGEEALADLVKRGALRADRYEQPMPEERVDESANAPEPEVPEEAADAPEEAGNEDEEAEELEPDTMDDVVDEAEESEEVTETKPKKNSGGRKAK